MNAVSRQMRSMEDMRFGDHVCGLYDSADERNSLIVEFIKSGLNRNAKLCLLESTEIIKEILENVIEPNSTFVKALKSNVINFIDHSDAYIKGGYFEVDRMIGFIKNETQKALDEGYKGLWIAGDMSWALLPLPGCDKLIEYEAAVDPFLIGSKCFGMCMFDKTKFSADILMDIVLGHKLILLASGLRENPNYIPVDQLLTDEKINEQFSQLIRSISENRDFEYLLTNKKLELSSLADGLPIKIAQLDVHHKFIFANQSYASAFGADINGLIGMHVADIITQKVWSIAEPYARRALKGETVNYDIEIENGESKQYSNVTLVPYRNYDSHVAGYYVICIDVTQKTIQTEQLRKQAEILKHVNNFVVVTDKDGNIAYWNDKAEEIFGYTAEEMIGNSPIIIYPEPKEDLILADLKALRSSTAYDGVWKGVRKDGSTVWIDFRASQMVDANGDICIVGVGQDITEHKIRDMALEEKLEAECLLSSISTRFINVHPELVDHEIESAFKSLGTYLDVDRVFLSLVNLDGNQHRNLLVWNKENLSINDNDFFKVDVRQFNWAQKQIRENNILVIDDINALPEEALTEKTYFDSIGIKSFIAIPVWQGNNPVAFIGAEQYITEKKWDQNKILPLRTIGEMLLAAINHRQSLRKLRERTAQLQEAQYIAHVGSWDWDLQTLQSTWSNEVYHIFEIPLNVPAEQFWETAIVKMPDEDRVRLEQVRLAALKGDVPQPLEYRVIRSDGTTRYCIGCTEGIKNDKGEVIKLCGTIQDITEKKTREKALQKTERLLKRAQEIARIGSWEFDNELGVSVWSDEMYEIFGVTKEQHANNKNIFWTLLHPDDFERIKLEVDFSIANKSPRSLEYRIICPDGRVINIWDSAEPVFNDKGDQIGFIGVLQDITEHVQSEERLRKSEERYRSLLEAQTEIILRTDIKGNYTYVNDAFMGFIGKSKEELLGNSFIHYIYENDLEEAMKAFNETPMPPGRLKTEVRMKTANGIRWVQWEGGYILNEKCEPIELQAVGRDVTQRHDDETTLKESSIQFRNLVENLPDIIIRFDTDRRAIYISPSIKNIAKVPIEEAIGKSNTEIDLSPDVAQMFDEPIKKVIETGEPLNQTFEYEGNKGKRTYDWRLIPEFGLDGKIKSVLSISRDITNRVEAEKALIETKEYFRKLYENAPVAYQSINNKGIIIDINDTWLAQMGYEREEVVGKPFMDFICPEYIERAREHHEMMKLMGDSHQCEYEMLRKDGSCFIAAYDCVAVKDMNGRYQMTQCVFSDITERNRTHQAILESEARFHTLFEQAVDGIVILDNNGNFLDVNAGICEMLGYTKDEILNMKLPAPVAMQDVPKVIRALELIKHVGTHRDEFYLERKDMQTICTEISASVFGAGLIMAIVRDITDRKKTDAELRLTQFSIDNAALPVYWIDSDSLIIYANKAAEKLLGYSIDELCAMKWKQIDSQIKDDCWTSWWGDLENNRQISEETEHRAKNGKLISITQHVNYLEYYNKQYGMIVAEDITERRKSAEKIHKQLERLAAFRAIDMAITSSIDLRVTFEVMLDQITSRLGMDAAAILLMDANMQSLNYFMSRGVSLAQLSEVPLRMAEDCVGKAAFERRSIAVADHRTLGNNCSRTELFKKLGFVSYIAVPLVAKGQLKGVLETYKKTRFEPDAEWIQFIETVGGQSAIAIDSSEMFMELQRSNAELSIAYDSTLESWANMLELSGCEPVGHTKRVTDLTVKLALEFGISSTELKHIRRGAILHDIGMLSVPDPIIYKTDELSPDEYDIVKQHTLRAYEMLNNIQHLKLALDIPYCHHERWDGNGYPRGLAKEQIPLSARIFSVIDHWDVLKSDKPYRKKMTENEAVEYITQQSGLIFDPQVVKIFLRILKS